MEEKLNKLLSAVSPLDDAAMEKARERQAQLAKPPGSLGRLEDLSVQLAGITGQVHNKMEKTHLLVFAADNGVVAEGVSSAPQSVTLMQTVQPDPWKNRRKRSLRKHFGMRHHRLRRAASNARHPREGGAEPEDRLRHAEYRQRPRHDPGAGGRGHPYRRRARRAKPTSDALGVGEMGIGNTTTSSAVLAVLLAARGGDRHRAGAAA